MKCRFLARSFSSLSCFDETTCPLPSSAVGVRALNCPTVFWVRSPGQPLGAPGCRKYGAQTVDEMFNGFVFYVADDEQLNVNVDPKSGRAK